MALVRVQREPLDIAAAFAGMQAGRTDIGGFGCFVGQVRGSVGERALTSLTLEHYPAMTEAALAGIAAEAERRWHLLGCIVLHRVGTMHPGEPIVLVLTAAPHRGPALEATAFLIDWLKTGAPFWKKEVFADGEERWVEARHEDVTAAARWA